MTNIIVVFSPNRRRERTCVDWCVMAFWWVVAARNIWSAPPKANKVVGAKGTVRSGYWFEDYVVTRTAPVSAAFTYAVYLPAQLAGR